MCRITLIRYRRAGLVRGDRINSEEGRGSTVS
jgi:hypothetical protein